MSKLKHILITRPESEAIECCRVLSEAGFIPHAIPMIAITPILLSPSDIHACLQSDYIIFVSKNAVRYFDKGAFEGVRSRQCFAVGKGTAMLLEDEGLSPIFPDDFCSEGLLALPLLKDARKKQVSIISGEAGRDALETQLRARGAIVKKYVVYRRDLPTKAANALKALMSSVALEAIVCTSGEGLTHLVQLINEIGATLKGIRLVVISPRMVTLSHDLVHDIQVILAKGADNAAVLEALQDLLKKE